MTDLTTRASPLRGKVTWLADIASFLFLLMAFVSPLPGFPGIGADSEWQYAFNEAVARHLVFGKQLLFTFGPYAFLIHQQYHPATYGALVAGGSLLAVALFVTLLRLSRPGMWALRLGICAMFFLCSTSFLPDANFLVLPFLFVLLCYRTALPANDPARVEMNLATQAILLLLALALALLPLAKATLASEILVMGLLGGIILALRGNFLLALACAGTCVVTMVLLWIAIGQPLSTLLPFFLNQLPIISGYTEAMAIPGALWPPALFIALCLLLLVHYRGMLQAGWPHRIVMLAAALALFLAFKEGFVRQDGHAVVAAEVPVLIAGAFMLGHGISVTVGAASFITFLAIAMAAKGLAIHQNAEKLSRLAACLRTGESTCPPHAGWRHNAFSKAIESIKSQMPLPPIQGSIDSYSAGQAIILAHGLDWSPRPILQSYSVYTPALEAQNAAHISGESAPGYLLFNVKGAIDDHLPALEDGLSWPIMLARYRPIGTVGDYAILEKTGGSTAPAMRPLVRKQVALGEDVTLPREDQLWARIDLHQTVAGKLVSAVFKPSYLTIRLRYADGRTENFRYIPQMGAAGFLLSPVVHDTGELLKLVARKSDPATRPVSFAITSSQPAALWAQPFTVELSAMIAPNPASGL